MGQRRMEGLDLVVGPVIAHAPPPLGVLSADGDVATYLAASWGFAPHTVAANITGQPAASLPFHGGWPLPRAIHVIGRRNADALVLAVTARLESELTQTRWRPPPSVDPATGCCRSGMLLPTSHSRIREWTREELLLDRSTSAVRSGSVTRRRRSPATHVACT